MTFSAPLSTAEHNRLHRANSTRITASNSDLKRSVDDLVKKKIATFHIQRELNRSTLELDRINNIVKVKWVGNVDLNTATKLLQLGADSVEKDGFSKLMLDRFDLLEIDTEARIWIKNFLKTRAKRLAKDVERMTIVNSKSSMGGIFSNMLTSTISLLIPNLKVKKFDTQDEGIEWLLE